MPGQVVAPAKMHGPAPARHPLILAICSLAALAVAVIAFVSALETDPSGEVPLYALLGLGVVSFTSVGINDSFNLRR